MNLESLDDTSSNKVYIYTDKADDYIIQDITKELGNVSFIIRDKDKWNIRYITGLIMDPNVEILVIHEINELSIAEIALASFMCKRILCISNTIKEYPKIYDMVTDLQPGCNLNVNNTSFIHWYNSIARI